MLVFRVAYSLDPDALRNVVSLGTKIIHQLINTLLSDRRSKSVNTFASGAVIPMLWLF